MKLTSHGAAKNVTGSKHLLEINGKRILLDCGMFQGHRLDSDRKNRELGFSVNDIDCVVLSHAHIDHSGLLPLLVKKGYRGPIFMTPATRDLCALMLLDSAHIQKRDSEWLSRKKMKFVAPLYSDDDVQETVRKAVSIPYEMPFNICEGVHLTFHDAGHVLGSAMVELTYEEDGAPRRFVFSGDIGRNNMSILKDPWKPTEADLVLMEGTYGDRDHGPVEGMDDHLAEVVKDIVKRGGKLIIPSFALERAQEIIYALKRLEARNAIPDIPVFVDSPLTTNITHIFRLHTEAFDNEFSELMREAGDPFQLKKIRYIRSVDESKALNEQKGPAIIISASGMCEFGRVVHHIKNHCEDPNSTILIVGFQAQHTLGRRIVERRRTIRIFGVERELNAKVVVMNEFSAHAGRDELIDFGLRFNKNGTTPILLVHGEEPALNALKSALETGGAADVRIQTQGKSVSFD